VCLVALISDTFATFGASKTAALGSPALESSAFILSAVRAWAKFLAPASLDDLMLVSTRIDSANRRRLPLMVSILSMLTSAMDTPATVAIDPLKRSCLSVVKLALLMGRDKAIFTTCVAVVVDPVPVLVEPVPVLPLVLVDPVPVLVDPVSVPEHTVCEMI
jgi:hypothetical protein